MKRPLTVLLDTGDAKEYSPPSVCLHTCLGAGVVSPYQRGGGGHRWTQNGNQRTKRTYGHISISVKVHD